MCVANDDIKAMKLANVSLAGEVGFVYQMMVCCCAYLCVGFDHRDGV